MKSLCLTPQIEQLARDGAWFAFSVSGGKDGNIAALAGNEYLDRMGHPRERRVLVHADLGAIEWKDSLRLCRELSVRLALPLIVVENKNHDMIGCWRHRWNLAIERYRKMETVTLVGPWSSSAQRFCTDRMKTVPISGRLVAMAGTNATIVSVLGIRGEESKRRAAQPVTQKDANLVRTSRDLDGLVWRPIHDWSLEDVWAGHDEANLRRHEAYTAYGASRVSCAFCVLAKEADLRAGTANEENVVAYRGVVALESESGFSFQSARWLGDVSPTLLSASERDALAVGKSRRIARMGAEARIPKAMLYEKGWPTFVPSLEECEVLARTRREVCALYGWDFPYQSAEDVRARYEELYAGRKPGKPPVGIEAADEAALALAS